MTQAMVAKGDAGMLLHNLIINGDLSKLNEQQKVEYYMNFCQSLGLNPVTQPFRILKFQGKEVLYATKDATEQLRDLRGISVIELTSDVQSGVYVVTCKVKDKSGKTDVSTGAVSIEGLKGEFLANAMMKGETKAKRRATLSICGLGLMDESEIQSVDANATVIDIPVKEAKGKPRQTLSEHAFGQAVERIQKGETALIAKLRDTYILNTAQSDMLVSLEDANIVEP